MSRFLGHVTIGLVVPSSTCGGDHDPGAQQKVTTLHHVHFL